MLTIGILLAGIVRTVTDLALGFGLQFLFFLLLFSQFFLTFFVTVIGSCQDVLSLIHGTVTSCGQQTVPR